MRISYFLPTTKFDNSEFENLGWSAEKIFSKTGIQSRFIAKKNEFALDLAENACNVLFDEHHIPKENVDYLLYCTQSPDTIIPTNACVLQDRLGLRTSTGALDINLGCSGFVYGLSLAKGLLITRQAQRVLLVTSETYSKYIHPKDKSNRVIFGDAAAATLLQTEDAHRLGEFVFGTDGRGAKNLCVKTGGLRYPKTVLTAVETEDRFGNVRCEDNLVMNGPEILSFTMHRVPEAVETLIVKSGLRLDDIHHFVFHQANAFLLNSLREKMEIPKEKFHIHVRDIGNTVSSSIPIALRELIDRGVFKPGERVLLAGFGVGYSWGVTIWNVI